MHSSLYVQHQLLKQLINYHINLIIFFLKNELGVSGHGSFGSKQKVQGNMCQGREGWTQVYGSIP